MRGNRLAACGARTIRSPSLISVVVCLVVERLAVYGVAVVEERSTHYDNADIALAIIVSPDTSGTPALAFGNHIFSRKQPCRWW